jgi:hypothetical protein
MTPVLSAMIASIVTFSFPSASLMLNRSRTASRVPLPSSRDTPELGRFVSKLLAGAVLAGAVLAAGLLAGAVLADGLLAGAVLADGLLAGELSAGELLAGELFAGLFDDLLSLPPHAVSTDSASRQAITIANVLFILFFLHIIYSKRRGT